MKLKEFNNIDEINNHKFWLVTINTYDYEWERDEYYAFSNKEDAEKFIKNQEEYYNKAEVKTNCITYLDEKTFYEICQCVTIDKLSYLFECDIDDILDLALKYMKYIKKINGENEKE